MFNMGGWYPVYKKKDRGRVAFSREEEGVEVLPDRDQKISIERWHLIHICGIEAGG